MAGTKILLTGATGYVGGEVLAALLASGFDAVKASSITCIVRSAEKAETLQRLGVKTVLFLGLDETDVLAEVASDHDVVIHTASGYHTLSARALVLGLAQRKKKTGKAVHYIHTSGTSNVADRPLTKQYIETAYPLSDEGDIFSYLKRRDEEVPYSQRTSDVVVTEVGVEYGVETHILMSPSLYGIGVSPLHEVCHVPSLIRAALKVGQVPVVGDGSAVWDHVHVVDMARCYETVLNAILTGQRVPSGKDGVFFIQSGEHSWRELSQRVADAGFALGALQSPELRSLSLDEAKVVLGHGWGLVSELGWASNSRTRGLKARKLGWEPRKTHADWENHFTADWEAILESRKNAQTGFVGGKA